MENRKKCLKREVTAVILTHDGYTFRGYNDIEAEIDSCPRKDYPSGMGYEMCTTICKQPYHAEVAAIVKAREAGVDIEDATLYLYGHDHCCYHCVQAMKDARLRAYVINGKEYML